MDELVTTPARSRSGGRSARMALRTGAGSRPTAPAFIRREIPPYELLSEEGLALVESKGDQLLAEVGIEFHDDAEALQLFKDAGATVDGITVRFDPGHVRALCATAPREFTQLARNPERSVQIGGNNVVLAPTYGSPFVRDLSKGRRYATLEDFQNFVKLAYATPWLHHSGGTVCEPTDIAGQQAPPRHGVQPPPLQRQGVHGLGHRARARRRFDPNGAHRLR